MNVTGGCEIEGVREIGEDRETEGLSEFIFGPDTLS